MTDIDGHSVISVVNSNEATQTPVQTGFREDGWVEISGPGLKDGNAIVTVGAYGLPEKTQITIANSSSAETTSTNSAPGQANEVRHLLPARAIRHAPRDLHCVHRGDLVSGGCVFRAAHALVGLPAHGFSAGRRPGKQRDHSSRRKTATITRPIEEAVKGIPGVTSVLSSSARGAAVINVVFDWGTDMQQAETYVLGQISEIRSDLPATAETDVSRVAFSLSYPIIGISLTSSTRDQMDLWNMGTYKIKPLSSKSQALRRWKSSAERCRNITLSSIRSDCRPRIWYCRTCATPS